MPALYTNPRITIHTRLFSLDILLENQKALITMKLFTETVNSCDLPHTHELLTRLLPNVLRSQCYNDGNIPFSEEVKSTEIGHLFEHILLEYLCMHKLSLGYKRAMYTGVTSWNWKKDKWGTFHIKINVAKNDAIFFSQALKNAIDLTTLILQPEALEDLYVQTGTVHSSIPL